MTQLRRSLWFYIWFTTLAAVGLAVFLARRYPEVSSAHDIALATALAGLGFLACRFHLHLSPKVKISLATAPYFMAAVLLSPPAAMGVVAASSGVAELVMKRRWPNVLFTVAASTLAVGISSFAYGAVSPLDKPVDSGLVNAGVATTWVLLPAATMYLLNTWQVSFAVSIQTRRNAIGVWLHGRRGDLAEEAALYTLAVAGAMLADVNIWTLALLLLPAGAVYLSLQRSTAEAKKNIQLNQELQKKMEELRHTEAQLVQSAKLASIGTLAAGGAHEVNNPVFVIQGRAEMLLSDPDRYLRNDKARQFVETINQMAKRISQITGGLLTFSRNDDSWDMIDTNRIVDETLDMQSQLLSKGRIQVVRSYGEGLPELYCCKAMLQQAIWNLIDNASDAMQNGGTLRLKTEPRGQSVAIVVSDTGPGIDEGAMSRLFEPFFTTKEVGKGTGLGLYISRRIVQEHGGSLSVESKKGGGAAFTMLLPVRSPKAHANGNGHRSAKTIEEHQADLV